MGLHYGNSSFLSDKNFVFNISKLAVEKASLNNGQNKGALILITSPQCLLCACDSYNSIQQAEQNCSCIDFQIGGHLHN
jgi:hypothetical protein